MSIVRNALNTLAERRAERLERKTLEMDLALYSSPADRLELEMVIARYPEEETAEVRDILQRQAFARAA